MRFTTQEIDAAVDVLGSDGVPLAIGGEAGIGYEKTVLARRPVPSAIPVSVQHEDAAVCFGLWCAA